VVDEGRSYLEEQFAKLGLEFVPSVANFIMVNVNDGPTVFKELLNRKVIVRPLKGYNLPEWVRITIGTMPQNKKCIGALKEILSKDRQA
jgi:histidinol-phosphate aminotransferase